MSDTPITVTEAARNFAECLNRAHYQKASFVLLKNGVPFARLVPAGESVCRGRELAEALAAANLPIGAAQAWRRQLKVASSKLKAPPDKWQ